MHVSLIKHKEGQNDPMGGEKGKKTKCRGLYGHVPEKGTAKNPYLNGLSGGGRKKWKKGGGKPECESQAGPLQGRIEKILERRKERGDEKEERG